MEDYEKRFAASPVERYIREATRKGKLKLVGTNDERGTRYVEEATKEILARVRLDLRGIARSYYRAVSDAEALCKKYKTLGACDAEASDVVGAMFTGLLETLPEGGGAFNPLEDWEKKLSKE